MRHLNLITLYGIFFSMCIFRKFNGFDTFITCIYTVCVCVRAYVLYITYVIYMYYTPYYVYFIQDILYTKWIIRNSFLWTLIVLTDFFGEMYIFLKSIRWNDIFMISLSFETRSKIKKWELDFRQNLKFNFFYFLIQHHNRV